MVDVELPLSSLSFLVHCPNLQILEVSPTFSDSKKADIMLLNSLKAVCSNITIFRLSVPSFEDWPVASHWLTLLPSSKLIHLYLELSHEPPIADIERFSKLQMLALNLFKASTENSSRVPSLAFQKSIMAIPSLNRIILRGHGLVLYKSGGWQLGCKGLRGTFVYCKDGQNLDHTMVRSIVPFLPETLNFDPVAGLALCKSIPETKSAGVPIVPLLLERLLIYHIDNADAVHFILSIALKKPAWAVSLAVLTPVMAKIFQLSVARALEFYRNYAPSTHKDQNLEALTASSCSPATKPSKKSKQSSFDVPPSAQNHWLVCDVVWRASGKMTRAHFRKLSKEVLGPAFEMAMEELSITASQDQHAAFYHTKRLLLCQFMCIFHHGALLSRSNRSIINSSEKFVRFLAGPWRSTMTESVFISDLCEAFGYIARDSFLCERLIDFGLLDEFRAFFDAASYPEDITTPPALADGENLLVNRAISLVHLYGHAARAEKIIPPSVPLRLVFSHITASQVKRNSHLLAELITALPRSHFWLGALYFTISALPHETDDHSICIALYKLFCSPYVPMVDVGPCLTRCEYCRHLHMQAFVTHPGPQGRIMIHTQYGHMRDSYLRLFNRPFANLNFEMLRFVMPWLANCVDTSSMLAVITTAQIAFPEDAPESTMDPLLLLETCVEMYTEEVVWPATLDLVLAIDRGTITREPIDNLRSILERCCQCLPVMVKLGAEEYYRQFFQQFLHIPRLLITLFRSMLLKTETASLILDFLNQLCPISRLSRVYLCEVCSSPHTDQPFHWEAPEDFDRPRLSIASVLYETPYEVPLHRINDQSGSGRRYQLCCVFPPSYTTTSPWLKPIALSGFAKSDKVAGLVASRDFLTMLMDMIMKQIVISHSSGGSPRSLEINNSTSKPILEALELAVLLLDASEPLLRAWQHSAPVLPMLESLLTSFLDHNILASVSTLVRKSILPPNVTFLDTQTASKFPVAISKILMQRN